MIGPYAALLDAIGHLASAARYTPQPGNVAGSAAAGDPVVGCSPARKANNAHLMKSRPRVWVVCERGDASWLGGEAGAVVAAAIDDGAGAGEKSERTKALAQDRAARPTGFNAGA